MNSPRGVRQAIRPGDALMAAARKEGLYIDTWQADRLAAAALSGFRDIASSRQLAHREMWQNGDYREHVRRTMRYELLSHLTGQGLVPVELPTETVRFVTGGILDPENRHEVPEESPDWTEAIITLEVPVRVPPIDRAAAVKAGILNGPPA